MMQRDLPNIDFTSQSEVRAQAEHRRTEEITGVLKVFFSGWVARFPRKWAIFNAVQYAPASAGNRRLPSGQS
jgi:hypothetical protein